MSGPAPELEGVCWRGGGVGGGDASEGDALSRALNGLGPGGQIG